MAGKVSQEGASGLLHAQEVHLNGMNGLDSLQRKAEFYDQLAKIRGSGGIEFPEEILDTFRSGSLEDIFRSGSLEIPEKAVDELVELMRSRPRSLMLEKPRPSQPLLSTQEVADAYITHKEDGGAAEGYTKVRARKLRFFARQHPELPTDPETIHAYLRQFKTADVPTRQDQYKALCALYKFASDAYGVPNPLLKVDKPRFKKKPGQRLSRDQAKRFLSVVETDLEWAAVTCYFGLRFRRVEAERLLFGDIKEDYIIVRGKERTEELPLLPIFRDKLLRLANNPKPNDRLFPVKGDDLAYHIAGLFKRTGIEGVRGSPHTLRNTAGRLWLTYGGDDRANRQLLRHSNRTMTDHYSELNIDELYALEGRFNPMLNLMRELELAPAFTNTSSAQQP